MTGKERTTAERDLRRARDAALDSRENPLEERVRARRLDESDASPSAKRSVKKKSLSSRAEEVDASVIVGLVNDGSMIDALLDALTHQVGDVSFEVIVASRRQDGIAEHIREKYPDVVLLNAAADTGLPELRTQGDSAPTRKQSWPTEQGSCWRSYPDADLSRPAVVQE